MTQDQIAIVGLLAVALALFVWNRIRFDLVAVGALLAAVLLGLVEADDAFSGFGNPAVITVAAVLVIGRALALSGAVDRMVAALARVARGRFAQMAVLCGFGALISAFMNNVGALALVLPVAIQGARSAGYSPSAILMPLSFATLLGGTVTLIGTPPNLLISAFREQALGAPYHLFDFAPVGLALTVAGLAYMLLLGWRLIPTSRRGRRAEEESFEISRYATEVEITAKSKMAGRSVMAFEEAQKGRIVVLGILRGKRRVAGLIRLERLEPGDLLMVQAETQALEQALGEGDIVLAAEHPPETGGLRDLVTAEVVVPTNAWIRGASPADLDLRRRHGVNLLAVSRHGHTVKQRLRDVAIEAGDVLLLQGDPDTLPDTLQALGCLPLAQRRLTLRSRNLWLPLGLFVAAIVATATGTVPATIAFALAVMGMLAGRAIPLRDLYSTIDWPVVVLLGAMIPVGGALETTGTAQLLADGIAAVTQGLPPHMILAVVLAATMAVTPMLNNAATVVIMAPIVIGIAQQLGLSPDPFLIAVAIGASCDFLTPFGHQNNTLIMGPGGYEVSDFWRVGLPLDAVIIVVSVLLIPIVWPFAP
ncbi:SLC13 family permease [Inquilinus limosus]|uniref:SLC13 family permease n=1 Tax=Inquilinus limosus TaxID=171674 RepID=UPI003F15BF04